LAPDFGEEENKFMNAKTKYTDEQLGKLKVVPDFLPSPEELVHREDTVKVTISLSKSSVAFFKREAEKHHTQYQKMIRRLLDAYTEAQEQRPSKR
jgi:predicted DNA binding CopG/RHH family protein